jgi:hypothetical protein
MFYLIDRKVAFSVLKKHFKNPPPLSLHQIKSVQGAHYILNHPKNPVFFLSNTTLLRKSAC